MNGEPQNQYVNGSVNDNYTELREVIGVMFLGGLCIFLLLALLRAQGRNRRLLEAQLKKQ